MRNLHRPIAAACLGFAALPGCAIETASLALPVDGVAGHAGLAGGGGRGPAGGAAGQPGTPDLGAGQGGAGLSAGSAGVGGAAAGGVAGTTGAAGGSGDAGAGGSDPCSNGVADAGETDVDCGLVCVLRCDLDQNCATGADCTSGYCDGQHCVGSQCLDHKQNGKESDLDCGGNCPPCTLDRTCFSSADCAPDLACTDGMCRLSGRTCRDIKRRNPNALDGDYLLDTDGPGPLPPFLARCDMTTDDGGWTAILRSKGGYTPTTLAVADLTKPAGDFAKLSDADINALAPGNRTFRIVGDIGVKSLYFITSTRFVDPAPGWGLTASPLGLVCEKGALAQCGFRQATWGSGGYNWIDTSFFKLSGDDCDRYFIDFGGTIQCLGSAPGQRCVAAGSGCPGQSAYGHRTYQLWLREWAPNEGLLASYPFDEGSGENTQDSTGHGLNGTLVGDLGARPLWTPDGHHGAALTFDGPKHTHVRVQFPDVAAGKVPASEKLFLPTSNATFSLWYRAAAPPTTLYRLQGVSDDYNNIDRTLDILPGEIRLQSYVYGRGVHIVAGKNTADGSWHHLAWSLDGEHGLALFVDGKLIDVASEKIGCGIGCSDFSTATRYLIGAHPGTTNGLTGSIDDVQLYQIPLTPEDIEALYEAQK